MQEFDLHTFQDNDGTAQQTGHRSWFYFGVSGQDKVSYLALEAPCFRLSLLHEVMLQKIMLQLQWARYAAGRFCDHEHMQHEQPV